jgi:hypothetical protein
VSATFGGVLWKADAPEPVDEKPEPAKDGTFRPLTKGALVEGSHVFGFHLPDGLLRKIGTNAVEKLLGPVTEMEHTPTLRSSRYHTSVFPVDFLETLLALAKKSNVELLRLRVGSDQPLVAEGLDENGMKPPDDARFVAMLAPRVVEE